MPEHVAYTCPDVTCDAYGQVWPVEVDDTGEPVDEAEARCPVCYSMGKESKVTAA